MQSRAPRSPRQDHHRAPRTRLTKCQQHQPKPRHLVLLGKSQTRQSGVISSGVAASAGQVDTWAPLLRSLTPQVVAQAGRPHCHLSGPAAHERVTTASKGAHHAHSPRPAHRFTGLMHRHRPHEDTSRCHHLQYRLSRTSKPKRHTTSNTQCPIIQGRTPDKRQHRGVGP